MHIIMYFFLNIINENLISVALLTTRVTGTVPLMCHDKQRLYFTFINCSKVQICVTEYVTAAI